MRSSARCTISVVSPSRSATRVSISWPTCSRRRWVAVSRTISPYVRYDAAMYGVVMRSSTASRPPAMSRSPVFVSCSITMMGSMGSPTAKSSVMALKMRLWPSR